MCVCVCVCVCVECVLGGRVSGGGCVCGVLWLVGQWEQGGVFALLHLFKVV